MSLWNTFLSHQGRVVFKWKHYFPAYEAHFSRFVSRPLLMFEVGCGEGGSLQMWKRYFGPHARIVGLDIRPQCRAYEEDQIWVRIGNQADTAFLDRVLAEFGAPDIVLDDGSHIMLHTCKTFGHLYHRVSPTGVYMVEDMHTAYWDNYGGGLRKPDSFIELCKGLIDELNADWTRGELPATPFTRATLSMHFYDSIVAFERGVTTRKRDFRMPAAPVVAPVAAPVTATTGVAIAAAPGAPQHDSAGGSEVEPVNGPAAPSRPDQ